MGYDLLIQTVLDVIDDRIKENIKAEELARAANYSLHHFGRIFMAITGTPVMNYVIRRKLEYALYELSHGKSVMEVAMEYGFETHAGFTKAFKRCFGYPPSACFKVPVVPFEAANILNVKHKKGGIEMILSKKAKEMNPTNVKILVNPLLTKDQLFDFYVRNGLYEAECYDTKKISVLLKKSDLIIGALYENDLVGVLRVVHDGLDAFVCEFGLELELQGEDNSGCGALILNDPYGIAKQMGLIMKEELNKQGIYFISYIAVTDVEEKIATAIGFEENTGHKQFIIDKRQNIN